MQSIQWKNRVSSAISFWNTVGIYNLLEKYLYIKD